MESKPIPEMTDLEFLNHWIDTQLQFINPRMLGELERRGLYHYVNLLGGKTKDECRAIMYSRLAKAGKIFGDPEIDHISGLITHTERLQKELVDLKVTEVEARLTILENLVIATREIKEYFVKNKKQS